MSYLLAFVNCCSGVAGMEILCGNCSERLPYSHVPLFSICCSGFVFGAAGLASCERGSCRPFCLAFCLMLVPIKPTRIEEKSGARRTTTDKST